MFKEGYTTASRISAISGVIMPFYLSRKERERDPVSVQKTIMVGGN